MSGSCPTRTDVWRWEAEYRGYTPGPYYLPHLGAVLELDEGPALAGARQLRCRRVWGDGSGSEEDRRARARVRTVDIPPFTVRARVADRPSCSSWPPRVRPAAVPAPSSPPFASWPVAAHPLCSTRLPSGSACCRPAAVPGGGRRRRCSPSRPVFSMRLGPDAWVTETARGVLEPSFVGDPGYSTSAE
nr:hypothetical protein KitaXyl93_75770 [Kitasatospora sp. Xyl93]